MNMQSTMTETKGSNINNGNGGWFTRNVRKRRLPMEGGEGGEDRSSSNGHVGVGVGVTMGRDKQNASPGAGGSIVIAMTTDDHEGPINKLTPPPLPDSIHSIPSSASTPSGIPASLAPYLGWTKLSTSASCRRRRIRQRKLDLQRARKLIALSELENDEDGEEEGLFRKVDGRAIFFIHDPLLDNTDDNQDTEGDEDEDGDNKIWFQGRFFPSAMTDDEGCESKNNNSNSGIKNNMDSWGILAETGENDVDDCLLCPDGGYRLLDLTFIRKSPPVNQTRKNNQYRRRWTAHDLVWTGGNMMALTTEDYSLPLSSSSSSSSKMKKKEVNRNDDLAHPFVNFEPSKLVEGKLAVELASKYFPQMVRRLQVLDIMEDGNGGRSLHDIMVLVGQMQVSAPAAFVASPPGWGNDD